MGKTTPIAWCDSTCNLAMGCSGCELAGGHCYAEALCGRMAGRKGYPADFRKPELFLNRLDECLRWSDTLGFGRLDKPWLNGPPRIVFLNDLGDTFDPQLPKDWLCRSTVHEGLTILEQLAASPHVYIILTKQAQRMAEFSARHPFPPNIWVGVSVTDQGTADERIPWLLKTQTSKRIVSVEPILAPVDILRFNSHSIYSMPYRREMSTADDVDWLISGGESGRNHRPCEVKWIQSLADQAKAAGVPCFVKQDCGPRPGQQGRIPDALWDLKEMPT